MKYLFIVIALFSTAAYSQTNVDSIKVKTALTLAGKRVTAISNDTATRNTDSISLITKAAARAMSRGGGAALVGITNTNGDLVASKWRLSDQGDFYIHYPSDDYFFQVHPNISGGSVSFGDEYESFGSTFYKLDDYLQTITSTAVNGYSFNGGNAWFASNISNPNMTIYQNGQIDIAESLDLYPNGSASFAGNKSKLEADGGGHLANWNIYWDANGTIGNDNNGAWSIGNEGAASFRSISSSYTDDYNQLVQYGSSWQSVSGSVNNNEGAVTTWGFGTDGLYYTNSNDGGDTYISNWSIDGDGTFQVGNTSGVPYKSTIFSYGIYGQNFELEPLITWNINNQNGSFSFDNGSIISSGDGTLTSIAFSAANLNLTGGLWADNGDFTSNGSGEILANQFSLNNDLAYITSGGEIRSNDVFIGFNEGFGYGYITSTNWAVDAYGSIIFDSGAITSDGGGALRATSLSTDNGANSWQLGTAEGFGWGSSPTFTDSIRISVNGTEYVIPCQVY